MKEILLTGASGFVGKNLKNYLIGQGYILTSVSLKDSNWKSKINSDAYAIVHLAGIKESAKFKANDYLEINTNLTIELFDFFNQSAILKFIYFSSVKSVAEFLGDKEILDEQFPSNPKSNYGISKFKSEKYILNNILRDKKVYILKPCIIHGIQNQGSLYELFKFVNKGIPYPFKAFTNKRSYLSIPNLNFIIQQLIDKNIDSGNYVISDSGSISTIELVEIMSDCLNKKVKMWAVPKNLLKFTAKIGSLFHLPFNTKSLQKITGNYCVNNSKILNSIGENLPLTIKEGIRLSINSYIQQSQLNVK